MPRRRSVTVAGLAAGAVALPLLLLLVALPGARAQEGPPRVDAAVQVTATPDSARAHAAPAVAVHPDRTGVLAVGEADAYSGRCGLHVSTDAGLTWTAREIPAPDGWPSCVQANFGPIVDVAFGPDGRLHYAFSGTDPSSYHSRMFLARSDDLGETFEVTELPWVEQDLANGEFGADALPSVAVDPNDADRVYVGWMSNNGTWNLSSSVLEGQQYFWDIRSRPYVAASTDGGASFGPAVDVAGGTEGWMSEPHLTVGADGAVHAFFGQNVKAPPDAPDGAMAPPAHLRHAVSTDSGASWATAVVHQRPEQEGSDWLSGPSPATDPDSGALYLVWEETADGPPRIAFIRSEDGGQTWSDPLVVNDAEPQRTWTFNEFFPSVSVAPSGRLDVAWYDWRNDVAFDPGAEDPDNVLQDVYLSSSTDGGRTWSPDVRITDRSIDRRLGVAATYGLRGPVAVASTVSAAFIAWSDTRNSSEATQSQDVYFTRARYREPAAVFGDGTAAGASPLLYATLGAGAALAVGGALLLVGTRTVRRPVRRRTGA